MDKGLFFILGLVAVEIAALLGAGPAVFGIAFFSLMILVFVWIIVPFGLLWKLVGRLVEDTRQ